MLRSEDIERIFRDAAREHPTQTWRARVQMARNIFDIALREVIGPDVGSERSALLRRAGRMVAAAGLYAQLRETLVFVGIEEEVLEMMVTLRDVNQYLHQHWDTLPDNTLVRTTDKDRVAQAVADLTADIERLTATLARTAGLALPTHHFTVMRLVGMRFISTQLGVAHTEELVKSINAALAHLRQITEITKASVAPLPNQSAS